MASKMVVRFGSSEVVIKRDLKKFKLRKTIKLGFLIIGVIGVILAIIKKLLKSNLLLENLGA